MKNEMLAALDLTFTDGNKKGTKNRDQENVREVKVYYI